MNINNIEIGMEVKNYKEMCKLLEEEIKPSGRGKKLQAKDWKRYFHWCMDRQKYIILDIYDKPLSENDLRKLGNRSKYAKYGDLLTLKIINEEPGNRIQENFVKFTKRLKLVNQNYRSMDRNEILKMNDMYDNYIVNFFDQVTYQKLREIVFGTLNNLQNRRLIDWEMVTMININEGYKNKPNTRPASDEERDMIRDVEKKVLDEMGLPSMNSMQWRNKQKEFYEAVYVILKQDCDINYYFQEIKIMFTHSFIEQGLAETAETIKNTRINEYEEKLNDLSVEAMVYSADKKYLEEKQKIDNDYNDTIDTCWGKPDGIKLSKIKERYDYNDVFLYAQNELIKYFVKV